jgi:glyoxylase-like metal-dependent hydrolase (beta-lactamase superfamily II)
LIDAIRRRGLAPAAQLITHGHADHIAGIAALQQVWPDAPIVIGAGDAPMLTDPVRNLSAPFGFPIVAPPADLLVADGQAIDFAGIRWIVREIPGHSPGHVVYVADRPDAAYVVGGDVLFQGSIGRTDFPGGNFTLLVTGIREKLFCLPDETIVLPGHGEPTTIGEERRSNPFCGERVR